MLGAWKGDATCNKILPLTSCHPTPKLQRRGFLDRTVCWPRGTSGIVCGEKLKFGAKAPDTSDMVTVSVPKGFVCKWIHLEL